jgi:hypothetical protein
MSLEADPRPRRLRRPRRCEYGVSPGAWMRFKLSTQSNCCSDHERREPRLGGRFSTGLSHARRGNLPVNRIAAVVAVLDQSMLEDA